MTDLFLLSIVYIFFFYTRWKNKDRSTFLVLTIFYIYISLVIYETLIPIVPSIPHLFDHGYRTMNLNPFIDIVENHSNAVEEVILNILLFVPFGFLFPTIKHTGFKKTVLTAFFFSLFIELVQPILSPFRASDITDLITNTTGAMIGYSIYFQYKQELERLRINNPSNQTKNES